METTKLNSAKKFETLQARAYAFLIDSALFAPLAYLESFVVVPEVPTAIVIGGIATYFLCIHFYSIYLHAVYGQTIGKMLIKIKVFDINEKPIYFKRAVLRESVWIAFSLAFFFSDVYQVLSLGITDNFRVTAFDNFLYSAVALWVIAEAIVALTNEKKRAIHDFIAGTVVVRID